VPDDASDNTQSHIFLTKGTMVEHYRVIEKIGAGGMGEVYLAEDTKLKRQVALKFLPSHLMHNPDVRSRFIREAQAVAKLNHPNIVTIHEVSEFNGRPFFVMEHIKGRSLHRYAHDTPLPVDTIVEFAMQICQGLGEAHRHGIIHRDIKSANISVDSSNRIRLLDFGLAAVQGDEKLTKTGSTLGTVAYMSPEQVSGRDVDLRSDLFSLGIVLYELLAGRTPFRRDSEGATLKAIVEDNAEPLGRYKADVPDKLSEIVFKLLEKDRELRYQSAEGVIADLKKLVYDSMPTRRNGAHKQRIPRKPLTYIAAAVVVVIIAGYFLINNRKTANEHGPVLAVLPFTNIGSDEDVYFSEGVTDEIRSRLNSLQGIRILSRTSVEKYRGTDKTAEDIGRELGADYLLEGTIRWDKSSEVERLRITPQLIQTENSFQLWSKSYERTVTEIFAVQAEIADQISHQLGVTLLKPEEHRSKDATTENLEAYNYYLRGLEITRKGIFNNTNSREALRMFDSAIALDSGFALAWAQKSKAATEYSFGYLSYNDPVNIEAKRAAEKSLTLEPQLVDGHIAMGNYYNYVENDFEKALAEFEKAESEISDNADLSESIGIIKMRQGKWHEAISYFETAAHLDPLNTRHYYWLATCYAELREFSKANQYVNRSYTLAPDNNDAIWLKIFINLLRSGKIEVGEYKFKNITGTIGTARASTFKLSMANSLGIWRFLPEEYHTEEMINEFVPLRDELSSFDYYFNLGQLYRLIGKSNKSLMYFDSSRTVLEKVVEVSPDDYHALTKLGLAYALLGRHEEAAKAGKRAKELLSVDDCHW
jgi:serine/threonine protein kinase/Tfp pilus assembly protein PilF